MATKEAAEPSLREKHVAAIEAGGSVLWHNHNDGRPITSVDALPDEGAYAAQIADEKERAAASRQAAEKMQAEINRLQARLAAMERADKEPHVSPDLLKQQAENEAKATQDVIPTEDSEEVKAAVKAREHAAAEKAKK